MHKTIVITVLALLGLALPVLALAVNFTADGNIVISSITLYEGDSTDNLLILSGATSDSFSVSSGVFTVTNPGSVFKVGSSNSTVGSVYVKKAGTAVACAKNTTPGTSYVSLPTTAADYVVYPSAGSSFATADCCATGSNTASYNAFTTCGAASCNSDYNLVGSGSTGSCSGGAGGGGGGGAVSVSTPAPTPTPTPSATPTPTPSVSPTPTPSATPSPAPSSATPTSVRPVAPATGSTPGAGITGISSDGALIRPSNDFRVYIVKGGYARWIQNPKIFSIYKHFKPSDVKVVSPADLSTKYTEASLVRAKNDPKVYEVNGDGTKHWLNMTPAQFSTSGRKWDMVYVVDPAETKLYTTGATVMYK